MSYETQHTSADIRIGINEGHPEELSIHEVPTEAFDAIPSPLRESNGTEWKVVAGITFFKE